MKVRKGSGSKGKPGSRMTVAAEAADENSSIRGSVAGAATTIVVVPKTQMGNIEKSLGGGSPGK